MPAKPIPQLRLHLSVQGSATSYEAVNFYRERFGIQRAVLPRVLSLAQVENVIENTDAEIELFGFGGLCVMVEGRCLLSSYACGDSPNTFGACSPGHAVRWEQTPKGMETRLNGVLIDRYADNEKAGYPTLCKGRFEVQGETYYALEEPTSLNSMDMLPEMARLGIAAIKIEGRQRSPAYVAQVTQVWRAAIDAVKKDRRHLQTATGLANGAGQGVGRQHEHARRVLPAMEVKGETWSGGVAEWRSGECKQVPCLLAPSFARFDTSRCLSDLTCHALALATCDSATPLLT
jgi:collagenase-like PrtC family protease